MNTPPLLLLAALTFWGGRTGWQIPAVIAGLLLESSRVVSLRWDFSPKDLRRIWDLCVLLLIGAVVYTLFSNTLSNPALTIFQGLPLLGLPMMLAQAFGHRERMPASTFSLVLRAARSEASDSSALNVSYVYFGVCLLAASATTEHGLRFYAALSLLLAWALWPGSSRRFSRVVWIGLLAAIVAVGHVGAGGLHQLHTILEGRFTTWIAGLIQQEMDPTESRTAIGQIGRIKLSGRIVLRVESDGAPPELLRLASYDLFKNSWWHATGKEFFELHSGLNFGHWKLIRSKTPRHTVTVSTYLRKGTGLIALPLGAAEIDNLPVPRLETNLLGAVRTTEGPGLVRYIARYGPGASLDGPTNPVDLDVQESEREAVARIAEELDLAGQPAVEAARRLTEFFQERFSYQAYRKDAVRLSEFLLKTRSGHCEYFASATVLLLRRAGVPARYATGYSVQESAGKGKYVVRARHAHAWAIYLDSASGAWRDLDTTPPSWTSVEADLASPWEAVNDFFSRIWYEFAKWRWLTDRSELQRYVLWLLIPLVAILTYRLVTAKRRARGAASTDGSHSVQSWPGLDSEFYLIERRLAALGLGREPGETATDWMARLKVHPLCPLSPPLLNDLIDLHYRYRFDPAGLGDADRTRLREGAQCWLRELGGAVRRQ